MYLNYVKVEELRPRGKIVKVGCRKGMCVKFDISVCSITLISYGILPSTAGLRVRH